MRFNFTRAAGALSGAVCLALLQTPVVAQHSAADRGPSLQAAASAPAAPVESAQNAGALIDDAVLLKARQWTPAPNVTAQGVAGLSIAQSGSRHLLLQFSREITARDRDALTRQGVRVLQYVPNHAVSAVVSNGFSGAGIPGLRWIGQLAPSDKISQETRTVFRSGADGGLAFSVVEFHGDVTRDRAELDVLSAGAQPLPQPDLPGYMVLIHSDVTAIDRLSAVDEVAWIYPAGDVFTNGERLGYCAGAITAQGAVANFVTNGPGWDGPGRGSVSLKYFFGAGTADVGGTTEFGQVQRAMREWSRVAQVSWSQTSSPRQSRSVDVFWAPRNHGDGFPFSPTTLAHTFYPSPPNPETIAGDLHLNDQDFFWRVGSNFDVFSVALHELGHSLGLAHSASPAAVMYPIYHGVLSGLNIDDINGIRSLYASATTPCSSAPGVPTGLAVSKNGNVVTLSWKAPTSGGLTTDYIVQVGSSSGASNVFNQSVGNVTSVKGTLPNGVYFARIRAHNACGTSGPSTQIAFTVP